MTTKPTYEEVIKEGALIVSWAILYAFAVGLVVFLILTAADPNAPAYKKPYTPTTEVPR